MGQKHRPGTLILWGEVLHRAPGKRVFSAVQALAKQRTSSADRKSREKVEIPAPSCSPAKLSPQDAGTE